MKRITVLILIAIATFACDLDSKKDRVPYDYSCIRPDEIPDTTCNGKKIHWDCDWYASYVNGHVKILRDSNGCITSIGREMLHDE